MQNFSKYIKSDLLSGTVVFLIAVPLCLGIALASGAPLFSGMISGIIGGIVVGFMSKSPLSVSGPAAGLTAIVLSGITTLGSFQAFLAATVIAGIFQLILGVLRAGTIGYYFPTNVIKGMLTAIGIIIIIKQFPYFVGYVDEKYVDETASDASGFHTFEGIINMFSAFHPGVIITGIISIMIIILWDKYKPQKFKLVPGAFLGVIAGVLINMIFQWSGAQQLIIDQKHLVSLPIPNDFQSFLGQFTTPDFSKIFTKDLWIIALTIGIVASIETLLTIEATDKIDPKKRFTDSNRELLAQGTGNILSGLIGGLPITSVIVRSSANLNAGAQSKMSTIVHGTLLLIGSLLAARMLNYIPLTSLAAILIVTGYKLSHPSLFKTMFQNGKYQWVPFVATVIAIVFTDLLTGVMIGMVISISAVLIGNIKNTYSFHKEKWHQGDVIRILLAQEVSFLNKAALTMTLDNIPQGSTVVIDATHTTYIDFDVLEMIREFDEIKAKDRKITAILKGFKEKYNIRNNDHIFYDEIPSLQEGVKSSGTSSKVVVKLLKKKNKTGQNPGLTMFAAN